MQQQQYNLVEGRLGHVFDNAEVLTVPSVKQLLYEKLEDTRRRVKAYETSQAYQIMQQTKKATEELQDFCAADSDVAKIRKRQLRLRASDAASSNAFLAGLRTDSEGNIVSNGAEDAAPIDARQTLRPFEAVQLATLVPQSVDEAVALIPSLGIYDEEDLLDVLNILMSSL